VDFKSQQKARRPLLRLAQSGQATPTCQPATSLGSMILNASAARISNVVTMTIHFEGVLHSGKSFPPDAK
jgi:hypothetical protein